MRKHNFITSLIIFAAGFVLGAIVDGRHLASPAQGALSNPAVAEVAAQTTQKSPASQKWEYRVLTRFVTPTQGDIDFELNRFGEQGFEVCGVAQSGQVNGGGTLLTIVFRRPR